MKAAFLLLCVLYFPLITFAQPAWQANLDSTIRFYQTTDFGIILAGTERSLYAIDGQTGENIWRRSTGKIEETSVTLVPDTDILLFTRDEGSKSRLEAVDLLTGRRLWESDKVKGDVMQLAIDPENDLIAVILVKDPRGRAGERFKRKPVVHVLRLSDGDQLWKRDFDNEIDMMPTRFGEGGDVDHTMDNYRAPLLLDGRLFLFYEGSTSYDARTGKEKEREKFKINEDGLALTEADPVWDERHVYVSGRGHIRAIDRRTGKDTWKADDLGITAEMALVGSIIYVRTGGQFTRIDDGELKEKGSFGISAIDSNTGKTLWRFKNADKGLTNFVLVDRETILVADKDELFVLDGQGEVHYKIKHKIANAQFLLINEHGHAVIGGRNEIAAFDTPRFDLPRHASPGRSPVDTVSGRYLAFQPSGVRVKEVWRSRHTAPSRGVFRTVAGIAARAAALYFRYGGPATTGISFARGGLSLAGAANSFRWSGLKTRFGTTDLTTLAASSARNYVTRRIYSYGSLARSPGPIDRFGGLQVLTPDRIRGRVIGAAIDRAAPSRPDVQESIFDRLDPARQLDRFSDYLLRRKRLAELRAGHMYFYTDLPKPFDKKGLVGVNVHTGRDARFILASDPDARFVTDETANLLYSADGSRLQAFEFRTQ